MTATVNFPVTLAGGVTAGFNLLPNVGGGFVVGQDFSADGSRMTCWTDVGGGYWKETTDTQWKPLFTTSSLPQADYDPMPNNYGSGIVDGWGCPFAIIDPQNKNRILASWNGYIYLGTIASGAITFVRTNLAAKKFFSNTGEQRLWQRKAAWNPTNSNEWIVCSQGDGNWYTQDGGSTYAQLTGTSSSTQYQGLDAPSIVCYDLGAPANIFISKHGTGIQGSTAGVTGSFTTLTGTPTSVRHMKTIANGTLFVVSAEGTTANAGDQGKLYKRPRAGSFSQITSPSSGLFGVNIFNFATDPADATGGTIVVFNPNGGPARTANGGTSWLVWDLTTPAPIGLYLNSSVSRQNGNFSGTLFPAEINFRPGGSGELWVCSGNGIFNCTPPTTLLRLDFYDQSYGVEEVGFLCALSVPGDNRPMFGAADKGIMRPANLDVSVSRPSYPGIGNEVAAHYVEHCVSLDFDPSNTSHRYALCQWQHDCNGYSFDGGKTWTKFTGLHPDGNMFGGFIIATGGNNLLWFPGNNAKAVRSTDGGANWSYMTFNGVTGVGSWVNSIWTRRYAGAGDKQRPGYAYVITNQTDPSGHTSNSGIPVGGYETQDHGANWAKVFTGIIDTTSGADTQQFYNHHLEYVPGFAGEMISCAGSGDAFNSKIFLSTDGGRGWTGQRTSEITNVSAIAFGKNTQNARPRVFFDGKVSGVSGIWQTKDWFGSTPVLCARFPLGHAQPRAGLWGDMNVEGRCFVGFAGLGLAYGNFQ